MKKTIIILLISLIQLTVFASDGTIYLSGKNFESNLTELISYDIDKIQINVSSSIINYRLYEHKSNIYAGLDFENGSVYGNYGDPDLPAFYRLIAIPEGADYEILFHKGEHVDIDILAETGADLIYPIQMPIPKSGDTKISFKLNEDLYRSYGFYPEEFVKPHEVLIGRGIRLLPLNIFPVKYNPVSGILRTYPNMQIEIRLSNTDISATRDIYSRYVSSYTDIYLKSAIGLQEIMNMTNTREAYYDGEGLLIICHDNFYDQMADFVEWKEIKGHRVTMTRTSEINNANTTAGIKAYIQNAYDNWEIPPSHIILVGSAGHIPTFTGNHSNSASDQHYVFLHGNDFMPDAAISRFTIRQASQLDTYLNKILYFEQFGNSDLSWMTDAALLSGEDSGWFHIGEGTLNYAVDNYLDPLGWDYDKLYRHTYNATKAEAIASMNAGKMISNYTAHCSPTSWAFRSGQYINNNDIHALTNQDMPFYAIGNCCQSSRFNTGSPCIGEAFVVADNAAIAYWGASMNTYWYEDDILAKRSYDGFFAEEIQMLAPNADYSKVQLWIHYSGSSMTLAYMEAYLIFGDGTTFIPKTAPTPMNVNTPSIVPSGSQSININVSSSKSPVNNALISAWAPEINVRGISRTDASGNATLYFDDQVTIPGTFLLTVTHPNHINHTSNLIIGTSSEGFVAFDKDVYTCNDTVEILLMDADLAGHGTYGLNVSSTSDPAGTTVIMVEAEHEGVFNGSLTLSSDLLVAHDDIITVTYHDMDAGDGSPATITDTALIDCEGPVFYGITIPGLTSDYATIAFYTSENAMTSINYGTDENNLIHSQVVSNSYITEHSVQISNLSTNTQYYFELTGHDAHGNQSTSDTYSFKTMNVLSIGSGTVELTNAPLYCYYHDNRTQVIYHASDLNNEPILIRTLAIDVTELPVLTLNNWTIRMKHTDKDHYASGEGFETDGWTVVYQSNETISNTGWVTFEFQEYFLFDGVQNLMIDFSFNNSQWQNPSGRARWTQTANNRTIHAHADSNFGDPLNWSGTTSPSITSTPHILNLRISLDDPAPDASITKNDISYSPANPSPGDLVTITAIVRNIGTEEVSSGKASFYHSLVPYEGLEFLGHQNFHSLAPQSSVALSIEWDTSDLQERPYIITVVLDDILPSDSNPYNNQAFIEVPLPVELAYFKAQGMGETAIIEWMTLSEIDNLGWNIYRLNANKENQYLSQVPVKLNSSMIHGQGNSSTPQTYKFTDTIISGRSYIYILESISTYGETEHWKTKIDIIM